MQRLILMRHATAERAAASGHDRDRRLSPEGREEALRLGRMLAERGLRPDLALVSDAARTHETWDAVHEAMGDVEVRLESALYDATSDTIRRFVEAAEDEAGCLIVVGHNPGVHHLAMEYLVEGAASPAALDRMAGFPPASAALFAVDAAGRCTFEGYLGPREGGR